MNGFEFLKHFATDIAGALSAVGITDWLKKIGEKAGGEFTPADMRYLRYRITGSPSLLDENLFMRAQVRFDEIGEPAVPDELNRRLRETLPSHMQDYYRLMLIGSFDLSKEEEVEKCLQHMMAMMRKHAYMGEDSWADLVKIMNLDQQKREARLLRLGHFLKEHRAEIERSFDRDLSALRETRDKVRDLNRRLRRRRPGPRIITLGQYLGSGIAKDKERRGR